MSGIVHVAEGGPLPALGSQNPVSVVDSTSFAEGGLFSALESQNPVSAVDSAC